MQSVRTLLLHDMDRQRPEPGVIRATNVPIKPVPRPRARNSAPTPFDPDDLTRRLQIVIAEREARTSRIWPEHRNGSKRVIADPDRVQHARKPGKSSLFGDVLPNKRSTLLQTKSLGSTKVGDETSLAQYRGESNQKQANMSIPQDSRQPIEAVAKDDNSTQYQHVPVVAASQFSRTATAIPAGDKRLTHRLSETALKFHMGKSNAIGETSLAHRDLAPHQQTKIWDHMRNQRNKEYDRNQFQHPTILEQGLDSHDKSAQRLHRHTIEGIRRHSRDDEDDTALRRVSTGNMLDFEHVAKESSDLPGGVADMGLRDSPGDLDLIGSAQEHRVDWTQSDQAAQIARKSTEPQLKKTESRWALRKKLGSFSKHSREAQEQVLTATDEAQEDPVLKSPRSSLFSRFKR